MQNTMENVVPGRRITPAFNFALFVFSAGMGMFQFLLSGRARGASAEGLILSTTLDMVRFLVVLFLGAYFVREFWNRLVSDIFALREMDTQEAIAFVLLLGIVFS